MIHNHPIKKLTTEFAENAEAAHGKLFMDVIRQQPSIDKLTAKHILYDMQIEINDSALTGKLERIANQDGVPVEQVAVDLLNSALAEEVAVHELVDFLKPRLDEARTGELIDQSPSEVAQEVHAELGY